MRNFRNYIQRYYPVPAILWGLFICIATLMPVSGGAGWNWYFLMPADKWIHLMLFMVFALLLYKTGKPAMAWVLSVSAGAALGVVTEWLQSAMDLGRHGDWQDWLADVAGTVAGTLLGYCLADKK